MIRTSARTRSGSRTTLRNPEPRILGAILAGGTARRMGGGDKGLLPLDGRPILAHVIARLSPQVDGLLLCANGDPQRFARFGLPVAADGTFAGDGPLAGLLAALDRAAALGAGAVATVPWDAPFVPTDLVARLAAAGPVAVAAGGGRLHPTCGLWPIGLREPLQAALAAGRRRVIDFATEAGAAEASFDDDPGDGFFNVNTPDDLAAAKAMLARG